MKRLITLCFLAIACGNGTDKGGSSPAGKRSFPGVHYRTNTPDGAVKHLWVSLEDCAISVGQNEMADANSTLKWKDAHCAGDELARLLQLTEEEQLTLYKKDDDSAVYYEEGETAPPKMGPPPILEEEGGEPPPDVTLEDPQIPPYVPPKEPVAYVSHNPLNGGLQSDFVFLTARETSTETKTLLEYLGTLHAKYWVAGTPSPTE